MRSSHIDLYLKGRDWSACERERPPWCVLYHYNSSCATVNLCRSVLYLVACFGLDATIFCT